MALSQALGHQRHHQAAKRPPASPIYSTDLASPHGYYHPSVAPPTPLQVPDQGW